MPDRNKRLVLLPQPPVADYDSVMRWRSLQAKIKLHSVARFAAARGSQDERAAFLEALAKRHGGAIAARIRRCAVWYFGSKTRCPHWWQNRAQSSARRQADPAGTRPPEA